MIWRFVPVIGMLALISILIWRSSFQFIRHGSWGIALFRSGRCSQNLRDILLMAWVFLTSEQAILAAGWPESLSALNVDTWRVRIWPVSGAVLMSGGLVMLVMAQLDMGHSWRIGIQEGASPGLITNGLYRFCRNPIFLALLIIMAGYTLLLPTLLSLVLLLGLYAGIHHQIAAEEEYLVRTYGVAYREYAGCIGRFFPKLRRIR